MKNIMKAQSTHLHVHLLYGLLGGPGSSPCLREVAQCFQIDSEAKREKAVTAGLPIFGQAVQAARASKV